MALIGLIALFLLSRVATLLRAGSLWFDEAFSSHVAGQSWSDMAMLLSAEHNPWVHFLILKATIASFGNTEWALRLPSVLAGTLTLLMFYRLGVRLFQSRTVGLVAGVFMTLSTMHLYHQTEARMYAFVMLCAALITWTAWEWLQAKREQSWPWLIAYSASALLLTHLHVTAWLYGLAVLITTALELHYRRQPLRQWLIVNTVLIATGLVWFLPILLSRLGQSSSASGWFFSQHEQGYLFTHVANFMINGETALLARAGMSLILFGLLAIAFIRVETPAWWQRLTHLFSQETWPFSMSFHWTPASRYLLIIALLTLGFGFALQITVTKYLIAVSVPLFLLMALGWTRLNRPMRWVSMMAMIALVLPMHLHLLTPRHHWDVVAQDVQRLKEREPNAIILVHSYAYALPMHRYLPEGMDVVPFYPIDQTLPLDQAISRDNWRPVITEDNVQALDALVAEHEQIILVSSTQANDVEDPVKARLWQQGWKLVERLHYTGYGDPEVLLLSR